MHFALNSLHPTFTTPRNKKCNIQQSPSQAFTTLNIHHPVVNMRGDVGPILRRESSAFAPPPNHAHTYTLLADMKCKQTKKKTNLLPVLKILQDK